MSMVKFCTLCDKCEKRSPEYSAWPSVQDLHGPRLHKLCVSRY